MNSPRQKRELAMVFAPESHILNIDTDVLLSGGAMVAGSAEGLVVTPLGALEGGTEEVNEEIGIASGGALMTTRSPHRLRRIEAVVRLAPVPELCAPAMGRCTPFLSPRSDPISVLDVPVTPMTPMPPTRIGLSWCKLPRGSRAFNSESGGTPPATLE